MINLNFLPLQEQKIVKRSLFSLMSKKALVWLVLISLLAVLLMLWGKLSLAYNLAEAQEQTILVTAAKLSLTDQIEAINETLKDVENIQAGYVTWSQVLIELSQVVPAGNKIDQLVIDSRDTSFFMKGFSRTREDLLALETGLNNSSLILDVESPLSNLLQPVDINFEFRGHINLNKTITVEAN